MRKFFVVAGALIALALIGLAIFVATFDADRYRPLVVHKLEDAIGHPVHLDRLSLGWQGGIALQLQGLAIYSGTQAQVEPVLQVDTVSAVVRLLPLLKRDVQVSSVVLRRPRVHVERHADGTIQVAGLPQMSRRPPPTPSTVVAGATLPLLISSLDVKEGTLRLIDEAARPPLDVTITAVDAALRNVSLRRPIGVEISMALFSEAPNLHLTGRVSLPIKGQAARIEAFRLEADLSRISAAQLAQALPTFKDLGAQQHLKGRLAVTIDRADLDAKGLADLVAQIHLADGRFALAQLESPLERLTIDAVAKAGHIELKTLSARIGEGTIALTGTVDHLGTQPQLTLQATAEQLTLETLLPRAAANEPQLRGRLSASFHGTAQGLAWAQISQTLAGEGHMTLADGVIANLNVVQEVFRRLSVLPGLVEKLQARLPESYQAKLAAKDTVFQRIELPLTVAHGTLSIDPLHAATDTFELAGSAHVGLDGTLTSQAMLRIDPELSAAIIKSVNELQYLTDATGHLELPIVIQGTLPRVAVLPDVQYVASRLVATKAQELLGDLLHRALEKAGAPK